MTSQLQYWRPVTVCSNGETSNPTHVYQRDRHCAEYENESQTAHTGGQKVSFKTPTAHAALSYGIVFHIPYKSHVQEVPKHMLLSLVYQTQDVAVHSLPNVCC